MRKIVSFVCAVALLCLSIHFIVLALENPTFYTLIRTLGIGVVFAGVAVVWLWEDFLSPVVRKRNSHNRMDT